MTLVQLRHLIALADAASFSKAAQIVHLTQPALSRSIKALEDQFGQPLFDRVGRRAELTPMGRDVLERARALVSDARELELQGRALAKGQAGELRVGMGSGAGAMFARPLLHEVASRRPRWKVEVARAGTELLVQRLRTRELDALVVDIRSLDPAIDLQVEQVCEQPGAFMVRPKHPLAKRGRRAVTFDELRAYPLASSPLSDEIARLLVQRYGPQAHPADAVNVRSDDLASLVEVATRSDAVLLAIRACAPRLVELRVTPPLDATARFGLVTLARRTQPGSLDLLRGLIREVLVR
jgi:DNA-binding transcriptional LysR family regulator